MRVTYETDFTIVEKQKKRSFEETVLEVGRKISYFYPLHYIKRHEIQDSVLAQGGDLSDVVNALEKSDYPRSMASYQMYFNYPKKGIVTNLNSIYKTYRYIEPIKVPKWKLLEGDSTILSYPCRQAQTNFRGRKWRVWYTPEIQVSQGPWQLWGLPGLVLWAEDNQGYFTFSARSIKQPPKTYIKFKLNKKKERVCSRTDFRELIKLEWSDFQAFHVKLLGRKDKAWDQKGRPLKYKRRVAVFMDKDD